MTTPPRSEATISRQENVGRAATLDRVAHAQEEFLKVDEIAARLRVSKMTVNRLIHAGDLQGTIRVGRSFRVPSSAVDAYLKASEVGA